MLENYLKIAIEAAIKAGNAILEIYDSGDFSVDMKADDSPLTKADLASNEVIISCLSETGIPVLSEEGRSISYEERKNWDRLWIVDPLDGTNEFIKQNGEFTVNIALIEKGQTILGVVYTPVLKELYYSGTEFGSFKVTGVSVFSKDLHKKGDKLPIQNERFNFTVVASRSHMSSETEEFIRDLELTHGEVTLISKGSSLKLCMVAEGTADCYPRFAPTMEWDTAAGQAVCLYAGFDVIDWNTKETMKYNRPELQNNWFLVQKKNE